MPEPSISALSFTSFVTNDDKLFEETFNFYTKLGFHATRSYVKDNRSDFELTGISTDSIKEIWLESFPLSEVVETSAGRELRKPLQESVGYQSEALLGYSPYQSDGVVIKLRLSNHDLQKNKDLPGEVTFFTASIDKLRAKLIEIGAEIIPSEIDLVEFSTKDPMGDVISFSSYPSLSSKKITSPDFFLHPKKEVRSQESIVEQVKSEEGKKKIAIITSGGDAPGMNAAVRAVTRAGIFYGCKVYACYEGYTGLVKGGDMLKELQWQDVRGLLSIGGTIIGTARSKEFRERWGRLQACYNMVSNGIDALVVCGGDGSLTGADLFRNEWPELIKELLGEGKITKEQYETHRNLTIVGLVGSIDNDMCGTDSTIGAYSSLERIIELVDYIDATAASHSRAFVVEVMGRHCGWLGLMSGIATGADYIFIPERPPSETNWKDDLKKVCLRHREKGRRKTTVIVAEGAIDDQLNPITSEEVKDVLVEIGLDTRITRLGHVQRGGAPCAFDRFLATVQGVDAVRAVLESTPAIPSPVISILENKIVRQPLVESVAQTKTVSDAIEAKDFDKALKLRDQEFATSYESFLSVSKYDDGSYLVPESSRLNIAIIHVGAPTSALNPATRVATLNSLAKGHRVFAIRNGFAGLIRHGAVRELNWIDVEDWHNTGGSEIGTNRSLPSDDMGTVAYYFQQYKFDGLIIIGGFEAFTALYQLDAARAQYPIFNIPMCCLPATVSNNVPGTEYSLGSDTCLNTLSGYCDAVKQSASASRRRTFVVEVQGGYSGYLASYAGLITGALAVYTPENPINLQTVQEDIELLTRTYEEDDGKNRSGKIFIHNEKASKVYTTDLIAAIIGEAGKGRFESRTAVPGHVQQGKSPSSIDRVNACRLAIKCCNFIEDANFQVKHNANLSADERHLRFFYDDGVKTSAVSGKSSVIDDNTSVVIGIQGSEVTFTPVKQLWEKETHHKWRKGKNVHWEQLNIVSDLLSGRLSIRTT
ncbi:6-phosphofructokinase subunit alpha [Komagataella phaffii CBS 7435]|uniref:ATP-dependent 6-phosphofructokinase subunit alpha n=2 Tax=Komagataella phaffii TaxID=460519 RepID=PFKA1_KOMPG|nr:Alpha subunit of heterooctameric phosphofructokinase involved in glycolysis [Komagataella phaffii GS115]Q92448.2 RecName: Full=ATP-dependent 6-phosphofructokinase subunit alpha; AltName: Full=ATP-dependent 6-phosphofructokinase 1; Short=ATP-PFK 1; Short=Phosphofructokinase 1; AltName: Full=Glucose-induced selective autophagy 1 protein; AltName: Full=Phosphohexokinase 1 [Komagataella phaffii GS115]AOA63104.1 GQ67_00443T0 [Komagataella phaffii]CAH2448459.1 6-phosphofructokinase subunit alpha [K